MEKTKAGAGALVWVLVVWVLGVGCGGAEGAAQVDSASQGSQEPSGSAAEQLDPSGSLVAVLPEDTTAVLELRRPDQVWQMLEVITALAPPGEAKLLTPEAWSDAFVASFGLPRADATALIASIDRLAVSGRVREDGGEAGVEAALLVTAKDASLIGKLLASERFSPAKSWSDRVATYRVNEPLADSSSSPFDELLSEVEGDEKVVAWSPPLLVIGDRDLAHDIFGVSPGESLADSEAYRSAQPVFMKGALVDVFADVSALAKLGAGRGMADALGGGAPIAMSFGIDDKGMRFAMSSGIAVPGELGALLPSKRKIDLGGELPESTLGYTALSVDWSDDAQRGILSLAKRLRGFDEVAEQLEQAGGVTPPELLDALGPEIAIGYASSGPPKANGEPLEQGAMVALIAIDDEEAAKRIVSGAGRALRSQGLPVAEGKDGFDIAAPKKPFVGVRRGDKLIRVAIGRRDVALDALGAKGKRLSDRPGYAGAFADLPSEGHVRLWLDLGRMGPMVANEASASMGALGAMLEGAPAGGAVLELSPRGDQLSYRLDTRNLAGTLAAVSIYGVRRYIANAKTSEAKNTIGAMARGAAAAFEREQGLGASHRLCKSAPAVPAQVPSGARYQPDPQAGRDYQTGDESGGWRCLRFEMTMPHYFQYEYRAMTKDYKGPARGGPNPGPNGFEVSAEGDLDGDGKTSLFTRVGQIENGRLKLSDQIFVADEFE